MAKYMFLLSGTDLDKRRATPKRLKAHAISDFAFQNDHSVCVRKPRCSSRF